MESIKYMNGQKVYDETKAFYPNGRIAFDGTKAYYPDGSIAYENNMVFFYGGKELGHIAAVGNKAFHSNGQVAWDGENGFDEDGSFMTKYGVAIPLSRKRDLWLCINKTGLYIEFKPLDDFMRYVVFQKANR